MPDGRRSSVRPATAWSRRRSGCAWCAPSGAGSPYEMLVVPTDHEGHLAQRLPRDLVAVGRAVRDALARLQSLVGDVAYNVVFHTAPAPRRRAVPLARPRRPPAIERRRLRAGHRRAASTSSPPRHAAAQLRSPDPPRRSARLGAPSRVREGRVGAEAGGRWPRRRSRPTPPVVPVSRGTSSGPGGQRLDHGAGGPGHDEGGQVVGVGGEAAGVQQRAGIEHGPVGARRQAHHGAAGARHQVVVDLEPGEVAVGPRADRAVAAGQQPHDGDEAAIERAPGLRVAARPAPAPGHRSRSSSTRRPAPAAGRGHGRPGRARPATVGISTAAPTSSSSRVVGVAAGTRAAPRRCACRRGGPGAVDRIGEVAPRPRRPSARPTDDRVVVALQHHRARPPLPDVGQLGQQHAVGPVVHAEHVVTALGAHHVVIAADADRPAPRRGPPGRHRPAPAPAPAGRGRRHRDRRRRRPAGSIRQRSWTVRSMRR